MTLAVVERFGPTIQGEGPQAGRLCSFIRFGACNLSCSWCDSAYTWDAKRYPPREHITLMGWEEALDGIPDAPGLVITGGEPLMQQRRDGWPLFLEAARARFGWIAVESNGTIAPTADTLRWIDQFVLSPKLSWVDMLRPRQDRTLHSCWQQVREHGTAVDLKFVVGHENHIPEAIAIADASGIPRDAVWLMPEGVTTDVLAERWPWVATAATEYGVNASHRLHVLVWGEERGH